MPYAVIFSSQQTGQDLENYAAVAEQMEELAKTQPGFIGMESARNADGFGITVSYWQTLEDIRAWKAQGDHLIAQDLGKSKWYASFKTRICKIEREYEFITPKIA